MRAKPKVSPVRSCHVCGLKDARGLVTVALRSKEEVTLCGTHELMLRRAGGAERVAEVKGALADRRDTVRRGPAGDDELAERLQAAFAPDRRRVERRAS